MLANYGMPHCCKSQPATSSSISASERRQQPCKSLFSQPLYADSVRLAGGHSRAGSATSTSRPDPSASATAASTVSVSWQCIQKLCGAGLHICLLTIAHVTVIWALHVQWLSTQLCCKEEHCTFQKELNVYAWQPCLCASGSKPCWSQMHLLRRKMMTRLAQEVGHAVWFSDHPKVNPL